jgi:tRNA dimethylallyltransferase
MSIKLSTIKDNKANNLVLVILGPTSSGKTKLAVSLAFKHKGEIVSADSRQVYKGMDIGTGKDLKDYKIRGEKIPYHLIDIVSPKTSFNLVKYQKKAINTISDILKRKKLPILVGGSGLYLQAVVDNYSLSETKIDKERRNYLESLRVNDLYLKLKKLNPSFAKHLNNSDRNNKRRLIRYFEIIEDGETIFKKEKDLFKFLIIGLNPEKEDLRKKIKKRLKERLDKENMIGEIKKLKEQGVTWKRLKSFGLEYKYISQYLLKEISYQEMENSLYLAICQLAKRQYSWFRRWEKQGRKIQWFKNKKEAENFFNK